MPQSRGYAGFTCFKSLTFSLQFTFIEKIPRNQKETSDVVVVLLWFSGARFCVRVSLTVHLMFVHINVVRLRLLSNQHLGKSCSLCILTICNFSYIPFWF